MSERLFDLNIEEVLDNWQVAHALREVISNALDEQFLSGTGDITIESIGPDLWSIRDYGRGLRIEHFTLNENQEKLGTSSGVIGKFGVGLKDALATFHRRGVEVEIFSRHGNFSLAQTNKHGFSDISTLHVRYAEPPTDDWIGTEFMLEGVTDEQMAEAMSFFLRFAGDRLLETTRYGQILERSSDMARVYISGVFASEEPNFLFSYNVTDLTEAMRKRLNRERLNVGRTTYSDRVKSMLKEAKADEVLVRLAYEMRDRSRGELVDELQWIDIATVALTNLSTREEVVFVTEQELHHGPDIIDNARRDGLEVVIVTSAERSKLIEQAESGGPETRTFDRYVEEFNDSFEYSFVEPDDLAPAEREVLGLARELFELVGVQAGKAPPVLVSETLRLTRDDTEGVWDPELKAIVVKRDQLSSRRIFAGTLLHELAHAMTGTHDATREFEIVLTHYLGRTSTTALDRVHA